MFVKVCGITDVQQIDWAVELGYSAVGFVVYPLSKRFVRQDKLLNLINYASGKIKTVAVSMHFYEVEPYAIATDFIQYYSNLDLENHYLDKTILAGKEIPENKNYKYFVYDESYGSGTFSLFPEKLKKYRDRLILAGGLNCENVENVIKKFKPFGIDVSSGVEFKPGVKDFNKMKQFISKVKEVIND